MPFAIIISPDAKRDIKALRVIDRKKVLAALDTHLKQQPQRESKSRIKRLRKMERPQYRLRVDNIRVYYDITGQDVDIIAVMTKEDSAAWLAREGIVATVHADAQPGEEGADDEDD